MIRIALGVLIILLINVATGKPNENTNPIVADNIISKKILSGMQKIPIPNLFEKKSDNKSIVENNVEDEVSQSVAYSNSIEKAFLINKKSIFFFHFKCLMIKDGNSK